ncbi:E3 ubiquitin-protein ligase RNF213 isoform X2 [Sagmatias obliquidens]|uniref:E3 ubiquitin-protein ligase RNF213 isoform X2 n=1 Tax=Sagmatias obliquidens TaxID=3371155 RepID=UPI000F4408B2|nr:E3 ubiquitin-protein ligase RNF213 isoform X2 [Lagenorhynchus obliquidens]
MPASGIPLPGGMECPSCRHISKEEAPKFCSQCGQKLLPAAPVPDSENSLEATSALEGEMECGQELREDSSLFLSLGSGDLQENPDEPCSDISWQMQREVASEGFVDAAGGTSTSDELEAASYSACKRRKEDATPFEVPDACSSDSEQRKGRKRRKRKKRNQNASTSAELDPLSSSLLGPCSLSSLANPELPDTAPPQSPAQQGGPTHQTSQPPSVDKTPLEAVGRPLQGQVARGVEAATGTESLSSPVPQDQTLGGAFPEGKDHHSPNPSKGKGLPTSASEGPPRERDAAQELPLPEPKGDHSRPGKEPQATGQQARAPASGASVAAAEPADAGKRVGKEVKNQTEKMKQPPTSVPASRDNHQEAATKDQMGVSGGKAGENEKAKPKDPKKPEGNNRNNAATVKNEREQRSQRESSHGAKECPLSSLEGITVYFHAIISKHFQFNPRQHKVFVRGGEEFGKPGWNHHVCEMYYTKDLHENGSLVEGRTIISKQHLDKPIPYKYVLWRGKGPVEYEFIYKCQQKEGEHVNRCLHVKSSLLGSGDWHQYDDIICRRPPGKFQKLMDYLTDGIRKDLVKGKQIAAAVMLDRIFSILETWNAINLKNFFTQFQQFYSVIRVPMIYEGEEQLWSTLQYEEKEVRKHLWECLTKKMAPFLEMRADPLPEDCPVRSKLRMGLIVLFSVEKFHFLLPESDLSSLCCLLCSNASSPDALRKDLIHILETSQSWRASMVNLCQMCMDRKVDHWVCALPVLHHCMDLSSPAQDSGVQPEDTWAALEGISFLEFREKRADQKQLLQLMGKNRHLLNVDEYLFRSWFSLLPLSNLVHYMEDLIDYLSYSPPRILDCLLGTWYRLEGLEEISNRNSQSIKSTFEMLLHLLDMFREKILEEPLIQSYLTVCLKLHETTCRITKEYTFYEMPALSAEIVCRIIILKLLVDSAGGQGNETGKKNSVKTVFQGTLAATRSWLQRIFQKGVFQTEHSFSVTFTYCEEIEVWRRLVEINFPAEHGWKESLLGDMEGRLKQEKPLSQISAFCSTNWDAAGAEDSVSKRFEMCAIEAVSSICQSQTSILEKISYNDLRKCGTLVSAVITKSWPRSRGEFVDDLGEVLNHLLTWPEVNHLLKLYGTNEKILENITDEGKKLMATADSVFRKVTNDLISGAILVGQLELIIKHTNQFLDIWQLRSTSLPAHEKRHAMKEVLSLRKNELVTLKNEKTYVDSLLKLYGRVKDLIKVDFGEIAERHSEDLSGKRLNQVVMVHLSATSLDSTWTTHYNLSPAVQEMARNADLLKDSHVFQVFWTEAAQELSEPEEELERKLFHPEEMYQCLYGPCFKRFTKLYQDLKSGEVTFGEIDDIFKNFVNKYSDLTKDLQTMCALYPSDQKDWIKERVRQIEEYHHLHQAVDSAKVILKVKENLALTGDFGVLHILLSFTVLDNFRHEKLDRINQQLIRAKKLLQDVNETRCQCLKELSRRKEFISWVREALGGITELKVFVDLASISAGENDIDVDRVACFHDAVQGFAPLLYELDTSAGFDEFMQHLKELWKALDNDHHLPQKLCDSARNLEWLKTVKESHGSVELSSLSLATAINSRGIYVIKAPADGQKISPDTVLHLILPEGHGGHEEVRDYSLEELKELLNKLMLMSGKKDHNNVEVVEVFSEVFCNVQRLVQSFINLYSAGNMLFRTWTAEVYCSPRKGASIRMDFGLQLVRQLVESGPVAELLETLCRQMEDFLDQWERFVAEKRAEHFYLNYYTAEQLVYLGSELRKQVPSSAALTMLSFIKGNCTPRDVLEACRGPDGRAITHQESTVVEELPLLLFSESRLVDKLRVIMKHSMTCMSVFLPHCLDLEALGHCLARLARMAGPPVQRELPRGLQDGQPNLVVCGHSEVLPAALAIYMQTPNQPLPTYDEVLLCTPETTFEEVALLLRRCLTPGSQGLRVYSLLYADQLSYEVACRAEELFLRLCMQRHQEHYRLVMVCDHEREHCYLPSAFSQHKVLITPQAPLKDIQAYLAHHFRVPEQTPSAAATFRDHMCVGIVASERAGVGRSLFVKRLHGQLKMKFNGEKVPLKIIRLINPQVDENEVLGSLLPFLDARYQRRPIVFHFDVTSSVQTGIWVFLFKLLILQYLMDVNGKMWLRNPCHLYIVEILEGSSLPQRPLKLSTLVPQFNFLDIFPKVTCRPPKEVISMELDPQWSYEEPGMDQRAFCSETFQRPYQYLRRFHQKENLDTFQYQKGSVEGSPGECIQHLLIYCGVINPSWSELRNFAQFLNYQLRDCEASLFCDPSFVGDTLVGFKNFVVTFMILMARDFATPTLHTSDQSPGKYTVTMDGVKEKDLAPFTLRKRWESEPHPYVFFNRDHTSMTFIGFHFQPNQNGGVDAIDRLSGEVIKKDVMTVQLYEGLLLQRVPFNVDFDQLPRHEKLEKLCLALGIQWPIDPDETYELTTDNMLKILAIEMRFRCGIPVIIMGETGCGKTRLIKFLSDLRRGGADTDTMKLVKVHGGTAADMIYSKVREAEALACFNKDQFQLDTILFFDEANTTEAISCIKEVLCDHTVGGKPLVKNSGLHIIAACNPYRKHTQEMICRLESAGLGYRVSAEETAERLGSIPLRQLVYRVHALPPSLIPLVWDFGQLNDSAEKLYIQQIVQRLVNSIVMVQSETRVITEVLSASQGFMRKRQNECSFVSLRDVERCVKVFKWFYDHSEMLLSKLDSFLCESDVIQNDFERDPILWSLVLAIGVCYHASLEKKESYRKAICRFFPEPYNDSKIILHEITQTQDLFLNDVSLRKTIAKNLALKENVFMMVICIELKIPLFLVGKPGSSKSLAKTIVADAMQGQAAHSDLFRSLKQVHLVSFQCSPHSTPQGIIGTFKQCARFQQGKDLEQYVSVVVLDEVGLAEDSPKMPLKALHPLLEDGCIEDDPAPHKKVGFIGISNWALDPAKMNRGIFVSRGSPNKRELIESARGICSSEPLVQERIRGYFASFAKAYETVCKRQDKEFFGLRDYYSLIKMVFAAAKASNKEPSPQDIAQAVLRNFSGKDDIHALDIFSSNLPEAKCTEEISTMHLIQQNIYGDLQKASGRELDDSESRYLLVLTRNYVALQILQQAFFSADQPEIIFGSSFPKDQEYTQICRNINRVKICMETGKMVVLLNLQNLYESLYDALNQYYVYLGGQKYVDLGLGTHRVKCRVHPDFRLIVIEEKDVVYKHFPIPLINRLEKHYLDINTVLEKWQKNIVEELKVWVEKFIDVKAEQFLARPKYSPSDVFMGYHSDTCASVVLQVIERLGHKVLTDELYQEVSEQAKLVLLDCATPDAVVRLNASSLGLFTAQSLSQAYYYRQQHNSFADFFQAHLCTMDAGRRAVFTEITTFSRLLTSHDCELLESEVMDRALKLTILSLQHFDTEYSFLREVRNCLAHKASYKILIIQTDFEDGIHSAQLIASAKYSAINEINKIQGNKDYVLVYFITKLSRMGSGTSFVGSHGGLWQSVHIDDLRRSTVMVSDVTKLQDVAISQLFKPEDQPELEVEHGAQDDGEEVMETEVATSGEVAEVEMETESSEAMDSPTSGPGSDTQILDTTRLLGSCIQGAVGMLRDQNEACQRSMRRVSILLSLLDEDAAFLRVTKMRLSVLLKKQEENYIHNVKDWVVREASNQDALQEAGTFRQTIWKRVQGAVTPLLASMISFMDRDGNLELLTNPHSPSWARGLWMFIFSDVKLLNIPLVANDTRSKGEMSYIIVQNYMNLSEDTSNSVPFSWRIKDYLEELWVHTQYITGDEGLAEKLVELFQQTALGRFLAQLTVDQRQELLQCYLKDFLLLTMRVSTWEELNVLQMALGSCINQLKAGRPAEEISLPSVHLAYQHFRSRLQNFSRILTIYPQVLQSLTKGTWNHSWAGHEMSLDVFAAVACAEMLTENLLKPSPQAWLQMVKNLRMPLELLCSDGYLQGSRMVTVIRDVRTQWNRIFSIALFVEHVLLGTESYIPELCKLVTEYVFLLNKCLQEDSDIKTHRPFVAVMTTLCKCKDQVSKSLTRFGVKPCPICLGDAQDPVCLPCDHVFCQRCVKVHLTQGQMGCPYCLTDLPDSFSPSVSQEHREVIKKHARFRQMCNSFFVDLVSTMCFKDNSPPQKDVVNVLLSLLFVEKELFREASQRRREHTKSLSPFDDVVDKTPVIRSVVLKLLLKYSFRDVKDYIQAYLSQLEKKPFLAEDKAELYVLFSSCLEDSIHEKNNTFFMRDESKYLREEGQFLKTYRPVGCSQEPAGEASVEYLQEMARIRLCLDKASEILSELQDGSEMAEEKRRYLRQVEHFCARVQNDWYRVYLVRKLTSQQGMEFVQSLSRQGHPAHWVFPRGVIAQQKDHTGQMDQYLVHGDSYKALRDALGKAILECKPLAIETALEACRSPTTQQAAHLMLALFREVTTLYRSHSANLHPKPQQCEAMKKFIEERKTLSPDMRRFAISLVNNELPLLRTGPGDNSLEGTVIEMAIHVASILLCGQSKILEPLKNLAFSPELMANAFLPTMPEDLLAQARKWMGLEGVHWYTCPNGHACSVGECGLPMEQSFCIDCGVPVGGINHKPKDGFHVIENNMDRTQTGHVLGNPPLRGEAMVSDRELSPVVFLLIRLLTHLAMLWGATHSPQALMNIIKPPVRDPKGFLLKHIQRDLEQLMKMLGRSADETASVVHLVLSHLLREHGHRSLNFDAELSTREKRNSWEKLVETIILPELKHLDKTLLAVNTRISQDERISSNPVAKIVYGDPVAFLPHLPQNSVVHCSKMWSCRKRITIENLQHIVEQKNGKETVPVLWKFLQKEAELRLVKFLPEILALQRNLVKRFQNVSEVEYRSIKSFISSHNSDGLKQLSQNRIIIFLSTWNKLRRSLETNGEIKLPKDYCSCNLDLDTDFEVILPRRQGRGLCSTALVSYLINLHNEIVYAVDKFSKEDNSYSVDASEVADLHVISYEVERDLIPLILSNCQYHVEQGGETLQEFDLEKIQRQIISRFLQGKPRLTLKGIPTLVYRRDWNYEHLFMDIKNKMPQSPLPNVAISAIRGQLQSYSDACEALSAIEVTLGFLSTAGGDPNMHLNVYIQDMLRMGDQASQVSKALNRCQLKHTISLWQFLSAHKSEHLLRQRKEPFGEISPRYKVDLSPENAKLLNTFLNQIGLDAFLLELHEMIVLKLKNPKTAENFNPEWSLRDTLVSYMETKESEILPEMESQFPEEILLSSCVSVWKMAAELKRNRQTR